MACSSSAAAPCSKRPLGSTTINGHLQLLARLSRALLDQRFMAALKARKPAQEILLEAQRIEKLLHEAGTRHKKATGA